MIDGRFDPAFAQLFLAKDTPGPLLPLHDALLGYTMVLATLACLWLMAPLP